MATTADPAGTWRKPFFTVWLGQSISLIGSMVVQFALIWWLTNATGKATVLAAASIVGLVPTILFSPFAGALVDRWRRRSILIFADAAIGATTLALALLAFLGVLAPWQIFVALFIRSVFGTFHWPAMQASTSLMVPHVHLARIKGLDSALYGVMRIVAPPAGALLLLSVSFPVVLLVDVVTAVLAIATVLVCRVPQPQRSDAVRRVTAKLVVADVRWGFRYLLSSRGLTIIILLGAVVNLLIVPFYTLLPIWVKRFYAGGPVQYGWIEAATGLGIIAGGVLLSVWGGFKKRIYTSMYGLLGSGLGCILAGLVVADKFNVAIFSIGIVAMMQTLVQGPMLAVLQDIVPPELQGRILTILDSLSSAMTPIGLVLAGVLADARAPQAWFMGAGLGFLLLFTGAALSPHVRNVETNLIPATVRGKKTELVGG